MERIFWGGAAVGLAVSVGSAVWQIALAGVIESDELLKQSYLDTAENKFKEYNAIIPAGDGDIARSEEIEKQEGEYRALATKVEELIEQRRASQALAAAIFPFSVFATAISGLFAGLIRGLRA